MTSVFSKMVETRNVFFTGLPLLVAYGMFAYSMGLAVNGKKMDPKMVLPMMAFAYTSLTVHVFNDLENDDTKTIQTAGAMGYGAVVLMMFVFLVRTYVMPKKKTA